MLPCISELRLGFVAVFTGTRKAQHVKVWDVRARAAAYELATGNNRVTSLAWDASRNTLYASTECVFVDTLGYHHNYRPGTKCEMNLGAPRPERRNGGRSRREEKEDDDDYEKCWPEKAWHFEDYYEYAFDSGDHRVCESFYWRLCDAMNLLVVCSSPICVQRGPRHFYSASIRGR